MQNSMGRKVVRARFTGRKQWMTGMAALAAAAMGQAAHGQLYWDINNATPGAGGATPSGTWDTALTNWSTDSGGSVATQAWTPGSAAVFSAGTDATGNYTVALTGTETASSVTFATGNATLGTGTLLLNGATPTLSAVGGATGTVVNISSASQVIKTGAGTVFLTTTGNVAGGYNVQGGELGVSIPASGNGTIGLFPASVTPGYYTLSNGGGLLFTSTLQAFSVNRGMTLGTGGGVVDVNSGVTTSFAGVIGGAGNGLVKQGSGTFLLSAANTYGNTTINAGTLSLGIAAALPAGGTVVVNSGGTFNMGSFSMLTTTAGYGVGTVPKLQFNGTSTWTGAFAGGITYSTGNTTDGPAFANGSVTTINVANVGDFLNIGSGPVNIGTVTVKPKIIVTGNGTLRYNGAAGSQNPAFKGDYEIDSGYLQVTGLILNEMGDSGNVFIMNGGSFVSRGSSYPQKMQLLKDATIFTDGSTVNTGINTAIGGVSIGAQTLTVQGSHFEAGGTTNVTATANTLTANGAVFNVQNNNVTGGTETMNFIMSTISDGGSGFGLTKTGSGNLNITGAASYTGTTTINNGSLLLTGAAGVAAGTNFVVNAGTLYAQNTLAATNFNRIGDTATVSLNGGEFKVDAPVGGTATVAAGETLGALTLSSGNSFVTMLPGDVATTTSNTIRAASLTRTPGSTAIFRGTGLGSAAAGAVANIKFLTTPTMVGGDGTNTTNLPIIVGAIGEITNTGIGATGQFVTYDATNGVRQLATAEYATTITDQTVSDNNVSLTAAQVLSGDTTINAVKLAGASGKVSLTAGTLNVTSGMVFAPVANAGIVGGTLASGTGELVVVNPAALTISSAITGATALTKSGAGALTLSNAADNYSGALNVNQGTLSVATVSELGTGTTAIGLASNTGGATLKNTVAGPETLTRNIRLGGAGTLEVTNAAGSVSLTGTISELGTSRSLVKIGAGTLTLPSGNLYSGSTTVNGGTLAVTDDSSFGVVPTASYTPNMVVLTSGKLLFNTSFAISAKRGIALGGGNFDTGVNNVSYAGWISGAGNLIKNGTGTLVLNDTYNSQALPANVIGYGGESPNAYTGVNVINAGELMFSGGIGSINNSPAAATATYYTINGTSATLGFAGNYGTLGANRGITLNGGGNLDIASGNTLALAGAITGSGPFQKVGAGSVTLTSATSDYTGGTNINGGTLILGSAVMLPVASNVTINSTGTLTVPNLALTTGGRYVNPTDVPSITLNTGGILLGTGTGASYTRDGGIILSDGASANINTSVAADIFTLNGAALANASPTVTRPQLNIAGAGTVALAAGAGDSFSAAFNLQAGTLQIPAVSNALGSVNSALQFAGGTLKIKGNTGVSLNSIPVTVSTGNGTITVDSTGAGVSHGFGPLTIATRTLTFSASANITSGTFGATFGDVSLTGNPTFTVNNGTSPVVGVVHVGNVAESGVSADFIKLGAGTLIVDGTMTTRGKLTAGAGTLELSGAASVGYLSSTVTTSSIIVDTSLTTTGSTSATNAPVISGAGFVNKGGTSTQTFSGTNTYQGGTILTAGTLVAGDANLGAASSGITFNGGKLRGTAGFSTNRNVTVSATGGTIDAVNGTQTITGSGNTTLIGKLLVTAGAVTLSRSGGTVSVTPGAAINVDTTGTLNLGGVTATFDGANYADITNTGTLNTIATGQQVGAITGSGTTTVADGASLSASALSQTTLTINGTGAAAIRANGAVAVRLANLTVGTNTPATAAQLDLNDNDLILSYTTTSPIAAISALTTAGYNGGAWNGAGIDSSAAQTHPGQSLGFGDAADVGLTSTVLDGVTIPSNAVIVKYTYYGDSSLDGKVDLGNDFNLFIQGFLSSSLLTSSNGWELGDYNYDGHIDITDFGLFVDGFAAQGGSLGQLDGVIESSPLLTISQKAALVAVVPEPASLGMIGACAGLLAMRRRRK